MSTTSPTLWSSSSSATPTRDRKSTRLNSSHMSISYAVFCLNDPAPTQIYTLSLHDALPICDTYDLQASHVIPALIAKTYKAKVTGAAEVEIWGTGKPRREFLHVDDLADALVFLIERYSDERSEEHTSELQSHVNLVCRLLLE